MASTTLRRSTNLSGRPASITVRETSKREAPVPWKPKISQKIMVKWLLQNPEAALFTKPGVGKTSATLFAFCKLRDKGVVSKMLVLAPLRVAQTVWQEEIDKWTFSQGLKCVLLHGTKKRERLHEEADIYVINYDGLPWLVKAAEETGWKWPDMCIADELTRLKNTRHQGGGARSKATKTIMNHFDRRVGLTGTPAPNGYLDLHGQAYFLDAGQALGLYITHYRRRFFFQNPNCQHQWLPIKGVSEKVLDKVKPLALSLEEKHYKDFPNEVHLPIYVDLPPDARAIYNQFEDEAVVKLEDGTLYAQNAAVSSGKMRQIAGGSVYLQELGEERTVQKIHSAKVDALVELMSELGTDPPIIAYQFIHEQDAILDAIGSEDVGIAKNAKSQKQTQKLVADWNARKLRALVGHPASMGHGLNLQKGSCHIIFFGPPWDLEHHDQTIGRLLRRGQVSKRVFCHYILARDTVDEDIFQVLDAKRRTQDDVFAALVKRLKRRQHVR